MREALWPLDINCEAATVLHRLSLLTGSRGYQDRAQEILSAFAGEYREHDLFGAAYVLAVCEIVHGVGPAGLVLEPVDWGLPGKEDA